MARDLGHPGWILFIWLIGGLIALAGALSYSELGTALPMTGGEYVYLHRAYGPLIGFLSGWTSFAVGFSAAIAAGAMSFAAYMNGLLLLDGTLNLPQQSSLLLSSGPSPHFTLREEGQVACFNERLRW